MKKLVCNFVDHNWSPPLFNRRFPNFIIRNCKRCKKSQWKSRPGAHVKGWRQGITEWTDFE